MLVDDLIKRTLIPTLLTVKKMLTSQIESNELSSQILNKIEKVFNLLKELRTPFLQSHSPQPFLQSHMPITPGRQDAQQSLSNNSSINSVASGMAFPCFFNCPESKPVISKECLESLRTELHTFIQNKAMSDTIGRIQIEHIHVFLLVLAKKMPMNETSFITWDKIEPQRAVYISSGHMFDLKDIIMTLHHFLDNNPFTHESLPMLDVCHIIKMAIAYYNRNKDALSDDDHHVALFLEHLHFPKDIVYVHQQAFLLDEHHRPYQIYCPLSHKFDVPKVKSDMIKSSPNICIALYEGLISMEDIKALPISSLELISEFHKSLDLLRSQWSQSFLAALKTDDKNDIFTNYINSAQPTVSMN